MVVVSYSGKEINAKLVYYGPGLSGKTTNLEFIYSSVPSSNRGKMVSMKTRTERTLFFDFLPVDLGDMGGFKTRFLLYTVPGQVYYNATRKLVLRGVDAIIFVADSARGKMDENVESLANLHENLREYELSIKEIPWVLQYNKRDLDDVYTIDELEKALNPGGIPHFEAVATTGQGVFETFRGVSHLLLEKLSREVKLGDRQPARTRPPAESAPRRESPSSAALRSPVAPPPAQPARPAARPAPPVEPRPAARPSPSAEARHAIAKPRDRATPPPPPHARAPRPGVLQKPQPAPEPVADAARSAPPAAPVAPVAAHAEPPISRPPMPPAPPPAPVVEAIVERILPEDDAEERTGFWGRLFGRGRKAEDEEVASDVTRIESIDGPGSGDPVVVERRVLVPVTISREEAERGARLRLVLELHVRQADGERDKAA